MTILLLIILFAYLGIQLIEIFLSYINLKHLAAHGAEVPVGFENEIDQKTLIKMRDYTLEQGKVGYVETFFDIALTLAFIFGGLLNWYNTYIYNHGWSFIVSGTLFFLIITYAGTVLRLPFSLFNTFHIEQKYGFNTQTFGLWCTDLLKSLLLSTILYGLILAAGFWIIQKFPGKWWLIVWAFLFIFSLFILYISPYVIEPLFNKFSPIEDESLEAEIKSTLKGAGLSISKVFQMDASKRTKHSNAYFTGIGHVKRIVLYDTLLKQNTREEVVAILAHEAGHWKKKHIIKRLALIETLALVGTYVCFKLVQGDFIANLFGIEDPTLFSKLLLVGFLGSIVFFPLKPVSSYLSRRHEREADDFAINLVGSARDLASSLVKLGKENLSNLHPHPWYSAFYYSHPPIVDRVNRLNSFDKQ